MPEGTLMNPREMQPKEIPTNPKQARLAIARDVIRHIKARKLVPVRGLYISFRDYDEVWKDSFDLLAASLYMEESHTQCGVCAIGAACMVAVGLYDDASAIEEEWQGNLEGGSHPSDISLNSDNMQDILSQWFSIKQLGLIECAFEGSNEFGVATSDDEERMEASLFRQVDEYDAEESLQDIFQNILDNDGTFRP